MFIKIFIFYFVTIFSNVDLLCYRILNHLQRMSVIRECTMIHMNGHKSFFRKKQFLIKRYLAKLALKFHFERRNDDKKSKNMSITCRLLLFLILSASVSLIKWWWNTIKHYWHYYWALLNWNVTCNSDCKFECVGGEKNRDYGRKTKLCGSFCLQCFVLNIWKKER
jgi:hypothetical protein